MVRAKLQAQRGPRPGCAPPVQGRAQAAGGGQRQGAEEDRRVGGQIRPGAANAREAVRRVAQVRRREGRRGRVPRVRGQGRAQRRGTGTVPLRASASDAGQAVKPRALLRHHADFVVGVAGQGAASARGRRGRCQRGPALLRQPQARAPIPSEADAAQRDRRGQGVPRSHRKGDGLGKGICCPQPDLGERSLLSPEPVRHGGAHCAEARPGRDQRDGRARDARDAGDGVRPRVRVHRQDAGEVAGGRVDEAV